MTSRRRPGRPGRLRRLLTDAVGGPARLRVVLLLACVLGLSSADQGTVGAVAVDLERSLHVGNLAVGLLGTVTLLTGGLAALPVGWATDRVRRTALLSGSVAMWAVAMAATSAAPSYSVLLVTRLGLAAVAATAGPTVASLTGDLFPATERSRMYGYVLAGELLGSGVGFLVGGEVAAVAGWRAAFLVLAAPALGLAWALHRLLPEPARGGQSWLAQGATEIRSAAQVRRAGPAGTRPPGISRTADPGAAGPADELARRMVVSRRVPADPRLVLRVDPARLRMWPAVRYVLRVRTNVVLILASALGYFFLSGLRFFAVVYVRGRYHLGQAPAAALVILAGAGALVGVLAGGWLADRWLRHGRLTARIVVPAVGYLTAAALFVPGLLVGLLPLAVPALVFGAVALAAPNPPLDAARLDVVPGGLWGRAEGVRSVLRTFAEAGAPLLIGAASQAIVGGGYRGGVPAGLAGGTATNARGLEYAFLLALLPLAAAGLVLLRGLRDYPRDVASAAASERFSNAAAGGATAPG